MLSNDKVLKCYLFIVAYCLYVGGESIEYEDCGSKSKVIWVQVDPCDDRFNCTLTKGSKAEFSVRFMPKNMILDFKAIAYIQIGDGWPMYKFPMAAGCETVREVCNVDDGEEATYRTPFVVPNELTSDKVNVQFVLLDQDEQTLLCLRMSGRVGDPK
ncbi:hypothetical protein M513_09677 [Trichuris suis]|uniref:MD-2-related lipid-recognition domain-containing protein n=1 Tax=Trichuris suis TaxID=68888 RepID=A0A085LWR4_9BILA|nr:hypothetical protein M513_09677 [Trichuris suis]